MHNFNGHVTTMQLLALAVLLTLTLAIDDHCYCDVCS